jgi:ABC-2 type transport system permease protein
MKRILKILKKQISLQLLSDLTYRTQIFFWLLADIVKPLLMGVVWIAVARNSDSFTPEYIFSYYFIAILILRLTQDWSYLFVSDSIAKGNYSNDLIKPFDSLFKFLGLNIGSHILRTALLIPFLAVGLYLFKDMLVLNISFINILIFIVFIIIGFTINFLLGNIFALITVWVKQMYGMRALFKNIISIVSGEIVPYIALPLFAFNILNWLPFRYIVDLPVSILVGKEVNLGVALLVGLVWIVLLLIIFILFRRKALSKYNAEGI